MTVMTPIRLFIRVPLHFRSMTDCMKDSDGDGYGDVDDTQGWLGGTDCDDDSFAINPTATEGVADGVDSDCNGLELCYHDADGDGYGNG